MHRPVRLEDLVYERGRARPRAGRPTREEMEAERGAAARRQGGLELAQGLLVAHVLAAPRAGPASGRTRCSRRRPEALELLDELRATGDRRSRSRAGSPAGAGPACSSSATPGTSTPRTARRSARPRSAVDLILLDPAIEVGVFRGGVVDHPRYAGERVFGSGINLTHLYHGRIDFLFYLVRDLGYVNKIYRSALAASRAAGRGRSRSCGSPRSSVRDRRRLPAAARRGPRDRDPRVAAVPARAQGGDHPGGVQPAPAALCRGPRRTPGDPVRAGVDGRRAGRRAALSTRW